MNSNSNKTNSLEDFLRTKLEQIDLEKIRFSSFSPENSSKTFYYPELPKGISFYNDDKSLQFFLCDSECASDNTSERGERDSKPFYIKKIEPTNTVETIFTYKWKLKQDFERLLNFLIFYNAYSDGEYLSLNDLEYDETSEIGKMIQEVIMKRRQQISQQIPLNQILYGPPGTGKTYAAISKAVEIICGIDNTAQISREDIVRIFRQNTESGRIVFTTFHQSVCYEDFIEGIKPVVNEGAVTYTNKPGIFKNICETALGNMDKNYVLIIDEINRGNVAQIFGELITLVEENKRIGNSEELKVTLPYSNTKFGVPNNLYIIGTMNTADRSVEALDSALRRRFVFEEKMPDYELLSKIDDVELEKLLKTINQRIVSLKGREYQIGHSYFLGCKTIDDIRKVFEKNVIPLLQEYFYENYALIQCVLNDKFVEKRNMSNQFRDNNNARDIYDIKVPDDKFKDAIQAIYKNNS